MTLEPVKCPYCGYRFRTDVEKIKEDGNAILVRGSGLSGGRGFSVEKRQQVFILISNVPTAEKNLNGK